MSRHLLTLSAAGMLAGTLVPPVVARDAFDRTEKPARHREVARLRAHFDSIDIELRQANVPVLTAVPRGSRAKCWPVTLPPGAETLKMMRAPDYRLEGARRSEVVVTRTGPVAIVSSRWQGSGTYQGNHFTDDQCCGQTWLQDESGSHWQLISEHCVQIASDRSQPPQ